jgi:hypothetical protein
MNEIRKIVSGFVSGLNDQDLGELAAAVQREREDRREKLDLADIRPGMSAEERARVREEIARLMHPD